MMKMLDVLASYKFDQGSEFFPPTNLEITTINVPNKAENVIPDSGSAHINIRFNDLWSAESLEEKLRELLDSVSENYTLTTSCCAQSFLTKPGEWSDIVRQAVTDVTGLTPEYTTTGGTSDARMVVNYCPVVEFGPINATIHQINENASVEVLQDLTKIYTCILELYFKI